MIKITKQEYKKIKQTNGKLFYKNNLQGKDIFNPYYMFKKDSQGDLGERLSSQREPSESNNIIHEDDQEFKTELENDFFRHK